MKKFGAAVCGLLFMAGTGSAFAATATGTVSVFPGVTVPGGTVTVHTVEGSSVSQPIKVTVTVNNPGSCISHKTPNFVGSVAMNMEPHVLRNSSLSLTTPAGACAGTYTVKVTVLNTKTNTVIATHTATFRVGPR